MVELIEGSFSRSAAKSRHQCSGAEKLTFEAISRIKEVCEKNANLNITTAAISWLLAKRRVASVITGASRPEQMELNCKIVELEKVHANANLGGIYNHYFFTILF